MNFLKRLLFLTFLILIPSLLSADSNKMLAVVNGTYAIFEHDLDEEITFLQLISPKTLNQEKYKEKSLKLLILNQMITDYLILEDSIKFKIRVTPPEINSAITYMEKTNKKPNGYLINEAKKLGLSNNKFYSMIKNFLVVNKVKQVMSFNRAKVSEAESMAELKRVLSLNGKVEMLLYEISISFKDTTKSKAEDEINVIYNQLKKGENFQSLARKFSETINSFNGGEIGWVPEVFLSSDVLLNLNKIKPSQYTKPFILENSYKIILLKEVRPLLYVDINNPEHLNQLTNYSKQKILNDKAQIALEDYLKETNQKASITIYNENL